MSRPLAALTLLCLLGACSIRPTYVKINLVEAPEHPASRHPEVSLPAAVDGAAAVVLDVPDQPSRVFLGGDNRRGERLMCAETPCAFPVPEGERTLYIEPLAEPHERALPTVTADAVRLEVTRGEQLLITHQMSRTRQLVLEDPISNGDKAGVRLVANSLAVPFGGFAVLSMAVSSPVAFRSTRNSIQLAAITTGAVLAAVTTVSLLKLTRRSKARIRPPTTTIERYQP
ncbi:MAG: hypothetical protein KTR31_31295 [Myxococcales bacterium]|nr:hypothetical protein [Myxococcales bacterium]